MKSTIALLSVLILTCSILPQNTSAAVYMKYGDIKGEATDEGHTEWINILAFKFAVTVEKDAASGLPTGRRQHKPFVVTKPTDKSTPIIMGALFQNQSTADVEIHLTRPGEGGREETYLIIKMKHVFVTSYQTGGSSGDEIPTEELALNYEEIEWTFVPTGATARDSIAAVGPQ